jgi:hypothetical protein
LGNYADLIAALDPVRAALALILLRIEISGSEKGYVHDMSFKPGFPFSH